MPSNRHARRRRARAGAVIAACALGAALLAQGQEPPSFRTGVDVIQLDVSVLGKNRVPVLGLTAADFTVLEAGKPQRIVSVSAVDVGERDPPRSAWMRFATRDVAANDLSDQLGDGRLFAVVIDDMNLPPDDADILLSAREAARHVIDLLGASDRAAVVFAQDAGKTQDFTDDHGKLVDAIDRLQPRPFVTLESLPAGAGPAGGDMAQRFSPSLARSPCFRDEPVIPALDAVTARLSVVPGRRKSVFYVGVGVAVGNGRGSCDGVVSTALRDIYRRAQRSNVNIHTIDPGGVNGYRDYLERESAARMQEMQIAGRRLPPDNIRALKDFLRTLADSTGGRPVIETNGFERAIDEIFEEDAQYYLVGYEPTNTTPDGKFRKVDVTVSRPDVSVRTRAGYWAPESTTVAVRRPDVPPPSAALSLSGLTTPEGVPLRVSAVPLAAGATARAVEVGIVLSVRWPPVRASVQDTLTVVRNVYDADGRPGPPVQETVPVTLTQAGGDETRVDLRRRLSLAPGRYQIRFNVTSVLLKSSGSIYADVEVPDLARAVLSLSGVALGSPATGDRQDPVMGGLLPLLPTTARDFAPGDSVSAFVRVFQGGGASPAPVDVIVEVFDAHDTSHVSTTTVVPAEAFLADRSASVSFPMPLDRLTRGPYLLSLTASLPGGRKARRDLVFRVR